MLLTESVALKLWTKIRMRLNQHKLWCVLLLLTLEVTVTSLSAGADDETGRQNTSNTERMCDTSVEYMKDLTWDIRNNMETQFRHLAHVSLHPSVVQKNRFTSAVTPNGCFWPWKHHVTPVHLALYSQFLKVAFKKKGFPNNLKTFFLAIVAVCACAS